MKTIHTTLLATSFLFVTYVAAPAPAVAGGWQCQQAVLESTQAEQRVDRSIDVAVATTRKGYPCISEVDALDLDVASESFEFAAFPDQCMIQDLLDTQIADLQLRAQNFVAHEMEVRNAQFQIVLARYERAVQQIETAWKNGEFAQDVAEKAIYSLRVDAFEYLNSLGLTSIRARLQEAITDLTERGMNAMDRAQAQHEFYVKLYTIRLEAALAVLQDRVTAGKATKADFHLVARIVEALDRLHTSPKPSNCN